MHTNPLRVSFWVLGALGCLSCGDDSGPPLTALDAAVTESAPEAGVSPSSEPEPNPSTSAHTSLDPTHDVHGATSAASGATSDSEATTGHTATSLDSPTTAASTNDGASTSATDDVTPGNGGTFTGHDAQVHVPDGAADGDIVVTIDEGTGVAEDGEWTFYAAGPPIALGPSGTTFSEPVEVTLTFSPEVVGDRPDLLVVAHRDDLTDQVTFIHPDSIDGNAITVSATSFSTFQPVMYRELMAGTVLDRVSNQPVAGAELFFYGTGYGNAVADANGVYSFTLENVTLFGGELAGTLYAGTWGFFQAPSVAISDLGAQLALPVVTDFTLLPSPPLVTGAVTDSMTEQGISDAVVSFTRNPMSMFRGGGTTEQVTTDSSGNYAIDASYFGENQANEFSVNLMVDVDGYLGTSAQLQFQSPITRDFALNSDTGPLLTGVVRDRDTNQPIPNAEVFFYGSGHGTVTADGNGVYTFTADDLSSFGGGLSGTLYVGSDGYFEAPSIPIDDLGSQPSLPVVNDIELLPAPPLVEGTITDSATGYGLAGVVVSFTRTPASMYRGGGTTEQVITDSSGNYAIDPSYFAETSDGNFSVSLMINAPDYLGVTKQYELHLAATDAGADGGASSTAIADFALNSSTGPLLTGTVTDRVTSDPIPGAEVFFYGSGHGRTVANGLGQYVLTIEDITSFGGGLSGTLYVGSGGYFEGVPIPVSDLGTQSSLPVVNNLTLQPSSPLVTGTVTDSVSNLPIADAVVSFTRNPMSTYRGGGVTEQVLTDNAGHYAIDASYFAESSLGDFTVNLMVNAPTYLGASSSRDFNGGPIVADIELTPGVSP
jgi:hypothetical protein